MPLNKNPFPGLRPFHPDESHLFFGRENHVKEVTRKLELYRFVSVVGTSGSGKSSLVSAGILPHIKNDAENDWIISVSKPGDHPLKNLCEALFDQKVFGSENGSEREKQLKENYEILLNSELGLVQILRPYLQNNRRLLLLIDQFEELFRFNNVQQEKNTNKTSAHFVKLLINAIKQRDVQVYVMLTIRSDFLGDCAQFHGLPEAINDGQFLVPRLKPEEMQLCITGPVAIANGKISPRLASQLLHDVGNNPDQLPILQHALMRTWEEWEPTKASGKPIDIEHYELTGGMEKALSNHADEAFAELHSEREKQVAEALFKIITVKGADNRGVRRPTSIEKISRIADASISEIKHVADVFRRADRGFLMPPQHVSLTEKSMIDISHESLMRVWQRLAEWVNEEAESAELYQRISDSALLYEKGLSGLWRDPDLQIALDWKEKYHANKYWAEQYNSRFDISMRFIDASVNEKRFALADKRRRRQLVNTMITIVLIMLSGLTIWAISERNGSERNAKNALEQKQKAEEQEKIAKEKSASAELNFDKAEQERKKTAVQKAEAEKQRKNAEKNAIKANESEKIAKQASLKSYEAQKAAENDKQMISIQKLTSDSLRKVAETQGKSAYRYGILSIAQNLAIKSSLAQKGTYDDPVKPLLAVQSYNFNREYQGKAFSPEIFSTLFSSERFLQDRSQFLHNYHFDVVRSVCFSPDGKSIASTGSDGQIIIAPVSNLQSSPLYLAKQQLILENLIYNNEGNLLACSGDNRSILIFDLSKPTSAPKELSGLHNDKISSMAWYKQNIVTASLDNNVRVIDTKNPKSMKTYQFASRPLSLSVCNAQKIVAIGCENGSVWLIDLAKPSNEPKQLKQLSGGQAQCVDLSDDGTRLACGTSDGNIYIMNMDKLNKYPTSLAGHKAGVTNVRFNPNGKLLGSSSLDGTVRLWDYNNPGELPVIFNEHDSWVYGLSFSNDGKYVCSGGKDKTVRLYPASEELMVDDISSRLKRNLTLSEWLLFVGNDIPYERTVKGIK